MVTRILIALCLLATVAQGQVVRKVLRPDLGSPTFGTGLTAWLPVDSTVCRASGLGWTISNSTAAELIGTSYRAKDQSAKRGMWLNSTNLYWKTTFTMSAWLRSRRRPVRPGPPG